MKKFVGNKILLSIIIPYHRKKRFFHSTIKSICSQTFKNYEHIIIDGDSKDQTKNIILKHKDKISYSISEPDKGLYFAMNKGIKKATGDVIGILNSDDIYYPDALKIINDYFSSDEKLDFLFGSVYKHKLMHGYYPNKIKWTFGFYTTHSVGFFIKTEAQKKIGLYDTQYSYSADYDLFYRMIVKFKLKGIATQKNEVLGRFRRGGLSSRIKYLDFLKENNKIRLNNGQHFIFVYLIFILRLIRNFTKIL